MGGWIRGERRFAGNCVVDGSGGHRSFLGEAMGDDRNSPAVKEVKQPVVDRPRPNPQFIDIVPQVVGLWSSKFMPKERQASNGCAAFVVGLGVGRIDFFQPIKDGGVPRLRLVEYDVDRWDRMANPAIALLRYQVKVLQA